MRKYILNMDISIKLLKFKLLKAQERQRLIEYTWKIIQLLQLFVKHSN